jgi:23S rRNA (uridine2552-2'-O)-methyltransferase
MREVQDHYFREAKREGYVSRAAYKLIEIDDRKRIMRQGDRVLDCGAAPGSWLQVTAKRVGSRGIVVGVDLQPIKHAFNQPSVRVVQADLTTTSPQELLNLIAPRQFDVILSDMAPNTSGDPSGDHHRSVRLCESLLDRCGDLLRPGGNLVMKVFEGESYSDLLKRTGSMFESARGFKPKASRSESAEMYIVSSGFRSPAERSAESGGDAPTSTPARKPSPGWSRR